MDPYRVYQNAGFSVMYAIFDTLITVSPSGSLGPGLADSWTSPDDKTLELKLHPGVKFQDGEPFDAAAVRFSLYRIADLDPATSQPYPVGDSHRLNSAFASNFASLASVEVVDPLTVRIHLSQPDSGLLGNLGTLQMVPPQYFAQVGNAGFALKPIGTGPFKFVEWVKDDHITLAANPDYWNSPRGKPLRGPGDLPADPRRCDPDQRAGHGRDPDHGGPAARPGRPGEGRRRPGRLPVRCPLAGDLADDRQGRQPGQESG